MANSSVDSIIAKISKKISALAPGSENIRRALTLIGIRVQADTALNIRRRGLIDKGRLINSIRYELYNQGGKAGVKVGSFGVPYAAVHEFGFSGSVNIRSYQRTMTTVFGRLVDPRKVTIGAHSRKMRIPARPYLRPAVRANTNYIIDQMRRALQT